MTPLSPHQGPLPPLCQGPRPLFCQWPPPPPYQGLPLARSARVGRVYVMSKTEAATFGTVVTGTPFLNSMSFCILFDSSAAYYFISTQSAIQLDLEHVKAEINYRIKLRNESIVDNLILYKYALISIGESNFPGNLIQFDLSYFNIIMGINWLHTNEAKIDCKDFKVILTNEKGREVCFYGQREMKPCAIIFGMKASKLFW